MGKIGTIKPNVALIGPLFPYRGGIAQHTMMLHRALIDKTNLVAVSFKRLYPKGLYPGKSIFEPGYKDYREQRVHYIIDTINPFSWVTAGRLIKENGSKILIIPWWTIFLAPCFAFIAQYLRKSGVKILFICHNVLSHENAFWKLKLTKLVLSLGDIFFVDNKKNAKILNQLLPEVDIAIHPMPVFHKFPSTEKLLPRRRQLELLFFGFIRPYKGVDLLLEAMQILKEKDVILTIAGEWWVNRGKSKKFIQQKGLEKKIEVVNKYLSEQEVAAYFLRADVIVLPYRSASGTGVIPLAYHYGRPVIATRVGGLSELVEDRISGFLIPPGDSKILADTIAKLFGQDLYIMKKAAKKKARHMNFDKLVEGILSVAL